MIKGVQMYFSVPDLIFRNYGAPRTSMETKLFAYPILQFRSVNRRYRSPCSRQLLPPSIRNFSKVSTHLTYLIRAVTCKSSKNSTQGSSFIAEIGVTDHNPK